MICFVVLLVCFLACVCVCGGGGFNGLGQSITFTNDGIFTSCTNEMNILSYNLYKGRSDKENLFLWVIVKHACFNTF